MWALLGSLHTICLKLKSFLCSERDECGVVTWCWNLLNLWGDDAKPVKRDVSCDSGSGLTCIIRGFSGGWAQFINYPHDTHYGRNRHHFVILEETKNYFIDNLVQNQFWRHRTGSLTVCCAACQFDTNSKFLDLELSDKPAFMSFCSLYLLFCQKTCEKTYINTPLVFFGSL